MFPPDLVLCAKGPQACDGPTVVALVVQISSRSWGWGTWVGADFTSILVMHTCWTLWV